MEKFKELKMACQKFIDKKYSAENLSQTLANIALSDEIQSVVLEAEYNLEKIRFCVSDDKQYDEGLKVVHEILSKVEQLGNDVIKPTVI